MVLKLRADTGARGTNLAQESGPVGGSIEQGLMGKKRKLLLVPDGNKAMRWGLSITLQTHAYKTTAAPHSTNWGSAQSWAQARINDRARIKRAPSEDWPCSELTHIPPLPLLTLSQHGGRTTPEDKKVLPTWRLFVLNPNVRIKESILNIQSI